VVELEVRHSVVQITCTVVADRFRSEMLRLQRNSGVWWVVQNACAVCVCSYRSAYVAEGYPNLLPKVETVATNW
jgi:hypothetical protein